jgi:3-hydroxy acid dehydrogenase / malonic semialdehyde reductase
LSCHRPSAILPEDLSRQHGVATVAQGIASCHNLSLMPANNKSKKISLKSKKRTVLITGATAGIGWATALAFLEAGDVVWALGRRLEKLRELKKRFPKTCVIGKVDVTKKASVDQFFKINFAKKIDILINNAGLAKGTSKLQDGNYQDWEVMIDTNVKGLLYVTSKVLPSLSRKPGSHIINISSVAGRWVYPGGNVYSASKFAVRALSEGLRMDLMGTGVKVTDIQPGMVETEFSSVRFGNPELAAKVYSGMTALKASDIAESILWCVNRPSHVNVSELTLYPVDQAGVGPHLVSRSEPK